MDRTLEENEAQVRNDDSALRGDGYGGVKAFEQSQQAGLGEQALHLFDVLFATGKLEIWWNSRSPRAKPLAAFFSPQRAGVVQLLNQQGVPVV
jgi:hypothetical protein